MASSPALHIDTLRPMVRIVLSDAIRQFAASLMQARPVLRPELVFDVTERILTPRPKAAPAEPGPIETPEYIPPGLRGPEEEEQAPSRARAIFHAAEQTKAFDPADLEFAFDENAESAQAEVPGNLKEPSPSQRLTASSKKGPFSIRQWILIGGMAVVECCVLTGFVFLILRNR